MSPLNRQVGRIPNLLLTLTLHFFFVMPPPLLLGAEGSRRPFAIPAADAEVTLETFSDQAGAQLVYLIEDVRGVTTNPVQGTFALRDALEELVARTELRVEVEGKSGAFVVKRIRPARSPEETEASKPETVRSTPTMKTKNPLAIIGSLLGLALAPASPAHAAESSSATGRSSGSISGRVQNLATGAYLEGALVALEPTRQTTLTSRDGSFHFSSVPAGEYRIAVSYTGLDAQTIPVSLAAGQALTREVALTSSIYALEKFIVTGEREGNALAITQQRNAPNIKNVIAADAFGNIADQNIGNLLARLPGVSEEILEGEVVSVSIRGVSADLNAVTLDGTRGANTASVAPGGTGAMVRGFAIDRIPADFIERIEVTKAATPDMDGDSIGGAVNLRTKSPLDRKGRLISYMGGTSWNLKRNTFTPIGSLAFADTYGPDRKVGVLVTASYNKAIKSREAIYPDWQVTAATNVPAYFYLNNLGEDYLENERAGIGARVDYKLSATHRVFLNTMYSDYKDQLDRRLIAMTLNATQIRPGWTDTVTESFNHPVNIPQSHRKRDVDALNFVFGGEKRFARDFLDSGASFSRSVGIIRQTLPTVQVPGVGFRFDRSDPLFPTITQISGPSIYDRSNHRLPQLLFQRFKDTDVIRGAHLNWKRTLPTAYHVSLKTGLRYRGEERGRQQERPLYSYVGPDGVAGPNAATGINDDNVGQFADRNYRLRVAKGRYEPVPVVDYELLTRHWAANPGQFVENIVSTTRDALQFNSSLTEDVFAAYLMGDVKLGRLHVTTGVRVEETRVAGQGVRQEITPAERARRLAWVGVVTPDETRRRTTAEWSNVYEASAKYRNALPSLHFKYDLSANLLARASYSTGIGRPNFSNLLRATTVDYDNQRVVAANPGLRPQTANNFDAMVEYYFEPAGFVSAGVFLKEIKDFIYGDNGAVIGGGPNNGFEGQYEGFELVRNVNGGSGRVRGFELAYQQRLNWLPGLWKGLSLMANYTKLESQGNYTSSGGVQTGAQLVNFMPETFNAGVSYTLRAWDVQVKYAYRAESLRSFNANPLLRVYYYSKKNVDLNLKYKWHSRLTVFVDVINVFDDPIANAFVYVKERPRFNQLFNPAIKAGISGRF